MKKIIIYAIVKYNINGIKGSFPLDNSLGKRGTIVNFYKTKEKAIDAINKFTNINYKLIEIEGIAKKETITNRTQETNFQGKGQNIWKNLNN